MLLSLVLGVFVLTGQAVAGGFTISPLRGFVITKAYSQPKSAPAPKASGNCVNGSCSVGGRTTLLQKIRRY